MSAPARSLTLVAVAAALALSGCAVIPEGPTYAAMPGSRQSFEQFQLDDAACRQYGFQATGITPNQAATNAGVGSAVVGTALGAAVGGLLGGSDGAAVGAGMGLFTGAAVGAGNAHAAGYSAQRTYDNAYYQCMYARGHKVPVPASMARSMRQADAGAAPAAASSTRYATPAPYRVPPPDAAIPPPNAPPPNAAVPPPNTPAPYQSR